MVLDFRCAEAEPLFREALDLFTGSLGKEHPMTLQVSFFAPRPHSVLECLMPVL